MVGTFNVNGGGPGEWSLGKVVLFLLDACQTGSYWHVTVWVQPMPEPMPERVKWPWPSVLKAKIGSGIDGTRDVIVDGRCLTTIGVYMLGTWPPEQTRIAENDSGFVRLSEVEDGKN